MKVLLRIVSVICAAIAVFLVYAVINAVASPGGARVGVCIAYVVGAVLLSVAAVALWRRGGRRQAITAP
jgi:multisubunit Na+/H+ antiporter MnhB subunit